MTRNWFFAALAAVAILTSAAPSHATVAPGPHVYGDFEADDVRFLGVTENSITDPGHLFGSPTAAANQLLFTPLDYASESFGVDADVTSSTLSLTIQSKGPAILLVRLDELGDVLFANGGGLGTQAMVSGLMTAVVTHLSDGTALATPIVLSDQLGIFGGGQFSAPGGPQIDWMGAFEIDVASQVPDAGTIIVNLNDTLMTASEGTGCRGESCAGDTSARIDKDAITLEVVVAPEPGAWLLLGFGLAALAARRRLR